MEGVGISDEAEQSTVGQNFSASSMTAVSRSWSDWSKSDRMSSTLVVPTSISFVARSRIELPSNAVPAAASAENQPSFVVLMLRTVVPTAGDTAGTTAKLSEAVTTYSALTVQGVPRLFGVPALFCLNSARKMSLKGDPTHSGNSSERKRMSRETHRDPPGGTRSIEIRVRSRTLAPSL